MSETVKVVVDVMGGDNAPTEPVKAAAAAVEERSDIEEMCIRDRYCESYHSDFRK